MSEEEPVPERPTTLQFLLGQRVLELLVLPKRMKIPRQSHPRIAEDCALRPGPGEACEGRPHMKLLGHFHARTRTTLGPGQTGIRSRAGCLAEDRPHFAAGAQPASRSSSCARILLIAGRLSQGSL